MSDDEDGNSENEENATSVVKSDVHNGKKTNNKKAGTKKK